MCLWEVMKGGDEGRHLFVLFIVLFVYYMIQWYITGTSRRVLGVDIVVDIVGYSLFSTIAQTGTCVRVHECVDVWWCGLCIWPSLYDVWCVLLMLVCVNVVFCVMFCVFGHCRVTCLCIVDVVCLLAYLAIAV